MPQVVIVSPATREQNNGNWHTASRWAECLRPVCDVSIATSWDASAPAPDLLIALHARRSAASIAAFHQTGRPCVLVMTGTDLYRDIQHDTNAQSAMTLASHIVVLQEDGPNALPPGVRNKTQVIFQSSPAGPERQRSGHSICMVGHLRDEKDPLTFLRATAHIQSPSAQLLLIGAALDPALGDAAQAAQQAFPGRLQWLGMQSHQATIEAIRAAHALAIPSRMEGGANVIIEAITNGVPVLASDIGGNRGMLGARYAGLFPVGDAAALAALIDRSITDAAFYSLLEQQCTDRAHLFAPARECAAVRGLLSAI